MNLNIGPIEKFVLLPKEIKSSLAFTVCSILQKGIQLFTIPLFTKMLTTTQYGQYSVFQSWYSIICIFATLNLSGGCFNNGMLKYPEDRDGYISSMQGLSTMVTAVAFVIYLIGQPMWNNILGLTSLIMYSMFLNLLFSPSITFWSAKQRYEYKYIALVLFTLVFSFLDPLIGLLAVSNTSEKGMARILSVCFVNATIGSFFYCLNVVRGKKIFQRDYWIFALKFNLPLIPHYLSQIVLSQSDRIMIEKMVGTSTVAVYSIAYNIGMIISIFITSINASFVPWTFEAMKKKQYKEIGKTSNGLVFLVGAITLVPIMFAPEAVRILGTEEYLNAVWVIPPVAISSFLAFIYSLFGNIEFYYEKSKFIMLATVIAAIVNIGLNYVCIKKFGYIAAGYTTFVCYSIMVLMHYLFMVKICQEKRIMKLYDLRSIILLFNLVILISFAFMILYGKYLMRYILILTIVITVFIKRRYFGGLLKRINCNI